MSYFKSTIKSDENYSGFVIHNSNTLIYANYSDNYLYSISANSNNSTQLGSNSAMNSIGSVGIYNDNIYIFSSTGYYYNYYVLGNDYIDNSKNGTYSSSLVNVSSVGNVYISDINTAYVASTYQQNNNSYVYKITNITRALSANPIITFSLDKTCNIGGVTSDHTYLYVVFVDVTDSSVNIMKFNISSDLNTPLILTSVNYNDYLYFTISTVSNPVRCDCYYFDNALHIMVSNTTSTKIYSKNNSGVTDVTNGITISSESNTFMVGKSNYGLKFFISTGANSGYSSTNNGNTIIKLYPSISIFYIKI